MRTLLGAVLVVGWLGAVASAAPHTILVMPLDGNVDAGLRSKLNSEVLVVAKKVPGSVSVADTTFEETAAAVGCDAAVPACGEAVRSTLGVDEIVYGRASTDGSRTTVVVYRVRATKEPHSTRAVLSHDDPPEAALPAFEELFPTDGTSHKAPPPHDAVPAAAVPAEDSGSLSPAESVRHPGRTRGIILTAAGGAALLVGVGLWVSTSSDQSDIDDANPRTADDFRALHDKEDRASRNAVIGDVLVGVGAGIATWGIITLVQSRHASESVVLAPRVSPSTAGVVLEGTW